MDTSLPYSAFFCSSSTLTPEYIPIMFLSAFDAVPLFTRKIMILFICYYVRYSPKAGLGRKYDEIGGCQRCQQFTDLPSAVFPMLCHLGPHLHLDPVLMIKIIRICKAFMKEVVMLLFAFIFQALIDALC